MTNEVLVFNTEMVKGQLDCDIIIFKIFKNGQAMTQLDWCMEAYNHEVLILVILVSLSGAL